jgi:putative hemolysin
MLLPGILLFVLCLLLSAFFSSSETAFVAVNPFSLEAREREGSRGAALARKVKGRTNELLATILIGNTLVNAAAASIATSVFVSLLPPAERGRAVLYATAATTLLLLVFSEMNPKSFAVHNPVRVTILFAYPIRAAMFALAPLAKLFSVMTGWLVPSSRTEQIGPYRALTEEEARIALHAGARGLSTLRRRIVSGALEIGSRPVREIMVPRPEIKAIAVDAPASEVLATIRTTGYSRYPVYRLRLDSIEGVVHAKDVIGYLIDKKDFVAKEIMREPIFVPESASLEKVLREMQEKAVHMAFAVDEFGNVEGLVTLEDIIEEIVGEIQDEHDDQAGAWYQQLEGGRYLIAGAAPVKDVNALLRLGIPEKKHYTTLAGFFLSVCGRLPHEKEWIDFGGRRLTVERMSKRRIALIEIAPVPSGEQGTP